jgi:protein-disulfide isomerase
MATVRTSRTDLAVPVGDTDHVIGPPDASINIVEYGDFECPNCKQAAPALKQLLVHRVGKVRLAYRHFPLVSVHPHALQAAEAAEAAGAQGQFWEMHDLLYLNQLRLGRKDLQIYAAQLGLDMKRFDHDMQTRAWLPKIRAQIEDGERSGVRSTPGIFLNGRIHDVSAGLRSLFNATDRLLASH